MQSPSWNLYPLWNRARSLQLNKDMQKKKQKKNCYLQRQSGESALVKMSEVFNRGPPNGLWAIRRWIISNLRKTFPSTEKCTTLQYEIAVFLRNASLSGEPKTVKMTRVLTGVCICYLERWFSLSAFPPSSSVFCCHAPSNIPIPSYSALLAVDLEQCVNFYHVCCQHVRYIAKLYFPYIPGKNSMA